MSSDYIRRIGKGQRVALPMKPSIGYEVRTMTERPSAEHIRVTVKVFGGLREMIDQPETSMTVPSRATLDDVLDRLHVNHPKVAASLREGLQFGYLNVLINGQIIPQARRASIIITEGDVIAYLPPVGGG